MFKFFDIFNFHKALLKLSFDNSCSLTFAKNQQKLFIILININ